MREPLEKYKPYFGGVNSTTLFWKPLYTINLILNGIVLLVIGLVFAVKFMRDYPHAAYIEKILQTFLLLCAFEVLHHWAYIKSGPYAVFRSVLEIGQYLTILTLMIMVYVFSMRLRFVLTSLGQYYEEMVAIRPDLVTRWRDEIDNAILRRFFKGKKYLGRLTSLKSNQLHSTEKQEQQP